MDLIDALQIPRPHIVYELLHFPRPEITPSDYEATMRGLHAQLREHTQAARAHAADVNARTPTGADARRIDAAGAMWTRETRFDLDARAAGAAGSALDRGR